MSLYPCSMCEQRTPGKLCQATWAWWRADNTRVAYRQRLCVTCFAQHISPLEVQSREFTLLCPVCGTNSEGDMDPVYLTVYVPTVGPVRLEMPCCGACAVELRVLAQRNATKLEDQSDSLGAADRSPQTQVGPWAALGIQPRE